MWCQGSHFKLDPLWVVCDVDSWDCAWERLAEMRALRSRCVGEIQSGAWLQGLLWRTPPYPKLARIRDFASVYRFGRARHGKL